MEKHRGLVYIPVTLMVGVDGEGFNKDEVMEDAIAKLHELDDMEKLVELTESWGYDPENAELSTDPRAHTFAQGLPDDLTPQ